MNKINWDDIEGKDYIRYFEPSEFSEDPDVFAEPQLIININEYRNLLMSKVFPSPMGGALARFDDKAKGSEHYAVNRKSTAIDVFPEGSILNAWMVALTSRLWTGIGVHFDTTYKDKHWCMLHLDNREKPLIWYRINEKDYYYPLYSDALLRKMMQLLLIQEIF